MDTQPKKKEATQKDKKSRFVEDDLSFITIAPSKDKSPKE